MPALSRAHWFRLEPHTLGGAANLSELAVRYALARRAWIVRWVAATGEPTEREYPEATLVRRSTTLPPSFAVRSAVRVPGQPPRFPSSPLVLCRKTDGEWQDCGFVDEDFAAETGATALVGGTESWLIAYLAQSESGQSSCRVAVIPGQSGPDAERPIQPHPTDRGAERSQAFRLHPAPTWRPLPPYPAEPGRAGAMAGAHGPVLIVAGGANFPDLPPWENGIKRYYDDIYVLVPGESHWRPAGRLPAARAYGAALSTGDGLLILGGEDGVRTFADSLLLSWNGTKLAIKSGPPLPEPNTNGSAAFLGEDLYLMGGYTAALPRVSRGDFWRLPGALQALGVRPQSLHESLEGLSQTPSEVEGRYPSRGTRVAAWQRLEAWPGPARALAVAATLDGALYLFSGLEMRAAAEPQPAEPYLRDAYHYRPASGWERLPDLPWSVVAAPSPAPVAANPSRIFLLGGVDGTQVGRLPRETPLPNDILCFDVALGEWKLWPEPWPTPVVTVPAVALGQEWVIVSGEIKPGKRTTEVWAWRPDLPSDIL